jgi:hypothetical protein
MSAPLDDYIVDVAYTRGYYAELSPLRAKLALLKAGLAGPHMASACELGFGQGVSLAIHAAASSTVWYGNDLNPEHVTSASALTEASGVSAHLYHDSFVEFARRRDLPDFDFIGLSGVWSWISDESRAAIVDFVRERLKVGGVLYINYITLPGLAPSLPLRELLSRHAEIASSQTPSLLDRVDSSLDFAQRFLKVAPAFFADNPAVAKHFEGMSTRSRRYLAHDYFNRHYQPMHFSTVASLLAPVDLHYVGPAELGNLRSVHLTWAQQDFLGSIEDLDFREFIYDFLVNRYARRDYWVRGPAKRLNEHTRAALLRDVRVTAMAPRPELPMKLRAALALNGGPAESIYKPLLEWLSNLEPVSLAAIETSLGSTGATLDQILDAVLLAAGHDQLELVQPDDTIGRARPPSARLNAHLLKAARSDDGFKHLASPVTGAGVPLERMQQLFLLAARDGRAEPEALATFARGFLPEEENLLARARDFTKSEWPLLKALGVA